MFKRISILAGLGLVLILCALATSASASEVQTLEVTRFTNGFTGSPSTITTGPDGNLWFTEVGRIGRITRTGAVTEFSEGVSNEPYTLVTGSDGNLWFSDPNNFSFSRITSTGAVTEFPSMVSWPHAITAGPDGNLWLITFDWAGRTRIVRITPAGEQTMFSTGITGEPVYSGWAYGTHAITAGPDGNVWFTEFDVGKIARITPAGTVTEFSVPAPIEPHEITTGPDGNLWFTDLIHHAIGRITPTGFVTMFTNRSNGAPGAITAGPDGNLWFTDSIGRVGRITPAGVVTMFRIGNGQPAAGGPFDITTGPGGKLWFTTYENSTDIIGRIDEVGPACYPRFGHRGHKLVRCLRKVCRHRFKGKRNQKKRAACLRKAGKHAKHRNRG